MQCAAKRHTPPQSKHASRISEIPGTSDAAPSPNSKLKQPASYRTLRTRPAPVALLAPTTAYLCVFPARALLRAASSAASVALLLPLLMLPLPPLLLCPAMPPRSLISAIWCARVSARAAADGREVGLRCQHASASSLYMSGVPAGKVGRMWWWITPARTCSCRHGA